jgi:tryptophan synthase alpha chain
MDGITIQKATQASLAGGFRVRDVFTAVEAVRNRVDAPVLVMTYWNPVVQYGVDRFADALRDAGGAGLITPDITPDSAAEWIAASERTGLDRVFLAAPSSTDERLKQAVEASRGFVYAVSTMGVTGARADLDAAARKLVGRLREADPAGTANLCVGVGLSTGDHVAEVLSYADGAIVGAALVAALAEGGVEGVARAAAGLARGVRLS